MKALVTGGTGFIGSALLRQLSHPVVLSRDPGCSAGTVGDLEVYPWDPQVAPPPPEAFQNIDVVFHLAGEPVAGRWNPAKKQRIRESRVLGTRNLVAGLKSLEKKPRALISASAVGYYGSRGDELLDESSSPGDDFLARVCRSWEEEACRAREFGIRVVTVRIGLVLGRGGGLYPRLRRVFGFGLGGRLGNGRQWMPWVHVDDVVGILMHAAMTESLTEAVNAVSPEPVTNRDFTSVFASAVRRPAIFPVPGLALRLLLGEMGEVTLFSERVIPNAAQKSGYNFRHTSLQEALRDLEEGR